VHDPGGDQQRLRRRADGGAGGDRDLARPRADLAWGAVGGASSYRVYRTDGVHQCSFGKILVGETAGTSFADRGLQNGRTYYYQVVPMGADDVCFGGAASACVPVAPSEVGGGEPTLTSSTRSVS